MNPQKKPKSRQEILKKQQQSRFVGREEHITAFRYNLALPPADWCFLFNIWGQGGVGKSTLLRQFRRIAEEAGFLTAYTSDSDSNVLEIMGRIAEQLEQWGYRLNQFTERYKVYLQKKQELEADPEAPQGFSAFLGKSIAKASIGLAKQVPGSGAITPFLDENTIANQAGDWASYVAKKIGNKDEVHLAQKPVEVLTPLFLQDLSKLAEQRNLLLLFDTYERTVGFLDSWLREILEGQYGDLSVNIILVIAGREELEQNCWTEYEGTIARISLEPFTEEEARQYLSRKGITNPQVIDVILRLSGHLPLLVATLAAESPTDPTRIGDPSGTAIERFLQWVDDPKRRQVALDAALPRYLNRDVIAVLHGEELADELFNWLIQMPFVEDRPDGWAYHNVARTQMLRHKQLVSPQNWADLHCQLADYYDAAQNGLELEQARKYQNSQWKQYSLNISYHRLCQAPQKHLLTVLNDFNNAVMEGMAPVNHYYFLQCWAETIVQTGKDTESAEVCRLGEKLSEGLREYSAGSSSVMLKILTTLLNASDWKFGRRGYTYYSFSFYNEALQEYNRACELDPIPDWVFGIRGSTFRRLGNYEAAIKDLDRAVELGQEQWMMHRAEVNLVLGNFNEALTDLDYALQQTSISSRLYYDRAVAHQALSQSDKAKADFELAIQLAQENCDRDSQDFRNTFFLARYHLADGNSEQAKHFYRDALSKGAPFPRIREAISDLKEFLIVFPNHCSAQQIREALLKRIGDSQ